MTHCFQGEYLHTCKYGQDEVCPAKPAAQPVVPQPPKLPFSYSAGTCRSFGEGTAKVSLYFDDIKEAEPWFDSLTVAPAPLVVEPVAKIVRNEAGQIRICDANGDSFDMSKYVGASFYTNPAPAGLPAWQPIETAPKDGTEIEIMVLHKNYQFCETDKQRAEWQQIVLAKWIDFNGGGWTWSGMAGSPWGWRPRSAAIAAQGERHETL
jgi:hypothetical protein